MSEFAKSLLQDFNLTISAKETHNFNVERIHIKDLSPTDKKITISLLLHKIIAYYLTNIFVYTNIPAILGIIIAVINIVLLILPISTNISHTVFLLTLPLELLLIIIQSVIYHKLLTKKESTDNIENYFKQKLENLWLLNPSVMSFKNWNNLKKKNIQLYNYCRSDNCNHKCYDTTYQIANAILSPDIKILWCSIQYRDTKCGHAVLCKNNKIYDSNLRRTFRKKDYFKLYKVQVFKEYSFEQYKDNENSPGNCFHNLDWIEFGKWCKQNNAIRANNNI